MDMGTLGNAELTMGDLELGELGDDQGIGDERSRNGLRSDQIPLRSDQRADFGSSHAGRPHRSWACIDQYASPAAVALVPVDEVRVAVIRIQHRNLREWLHCKAID